MATPTATALGARDGARALARASAVTRSKSGATAESLAIITPTDTGAVITIPLGGRTRGAAWHTTAEDRIELKIGKRATKRAGIGCVLAHDAARAMRTGEGPAKTAASARWRAGSKTIDADKTQRGQCAGAALAAALGHATRFTTNENPESGLSRLTIEAHGPHALRVSACDSAMLGWCDIEAQASSAFTATISRHSAGAVARMLASADTVTIDAERWRIARFTEGPIAVLCVEHGDQGYALSALVERTCAEAPRHATVDARTFAQGLDAAMARVAARDTDDPPATALARRLKRTSAQNIPAGTGTATLSAHAGRLVVTVHGIRSAATASFEMSADTEGTRQDATCASANASAERLATALRTLTGATQVRWGTDTRPIVLSGTQGGVVIAQTSGAEPAAHAA